MGGGSGTHTGLAFHDFNIGPLPTASGHNIVFSGHTAVRLLATMPRPGPLPSGRAVVRPTGGDNE
jgi:hypothetical protein